MVKHNTDTSLLGGFAVLVASCLLIIHPPSVIHGDIPKQYPYEPVFAHFTLPADTLLATSATFRCVVSRPAGDSITNDISRLRIWTYRDHATNPLIKCLAYVDTHFNQPSIFATPGQYTIVIHGYTNTIRIMPHDLRSDAVTIPIRMLLFRIATLADASDFTSQLREYSLQLLELSDHSPYSFYARTYLAADTYYTQLKTLKTDYEGRATPDIQSILSTFPAMEPPDTLIGATYIYLMSQSLIYSDPMGAVNLKRRLLMQYSISPYHERIVRELNAVDGHEIRD